MQRWHLTFGLATAAVVGAWLAPRLVGLGSTVEPLRPPDLSPPRPATGHLVLDAGLDRWAVPSGTSAERYLTITVRAPDDLGVRERRPVDLSVVLDASGSMADAGKIDNARTAAKVLASSMEPTDTWSLVTFSDAASVVVPAARLDGVAAIHDQIDRVREGGGTNLFAGLEAGAREVERSLQTAHAEDGRRPVGRVVLLSDGIANVGVVDDETLSRFASRLASSGITVSTVGLGLDYNEDLLAHLADVGGGSYAFVDDAGDLEAAFADELERSSAVVARDTRVRITVPEGAGTVEIVGWDATPVSGGWDVFLGDVPAGATRKIVARLVVEPRPVGALPVATVTAEWFNLVDETRASAEQVVSAVVTDDPAVVDASLDRDKAIEATRARGSWYLDRSTRAFATGDAALSKKFLDEGKALYQSATSSLGDHFAPMSDAIIVAEGKYQINLPESPEGRRAIKENKEKVREFSGEIVAVSAAELAPFMERTALEQLPRRQAAWMVGSIGAAALLATTSLWAVQPEIALAVALGAGASCVDPRRLWASPLVVAAVVVAALASIVLGWPAVVGAGAVAGACATWLFPQRTGTIDLVHGALGGLAGASIGLWAATALVPAAWPLALQSVVTTGIVALVGSQGLLPVAVRFDQAPRFPSHRLVSKTLRVAYRPPVLRAIDLYTSSQAQAPDAETRQGMAEVVTWVFRLQVTLQALDGELAQIDPEQVGDRITRARASEDEHDAFVRERRLATVSHLERLLDHRSAIALERARSAALVDHAGAFLEEARAALALAQHRPGETVPDRLPEVLRRLREHASEGEARRRTARELGS